MAHPTIVRVFDAGEESTRDAAGNELQLPFIVMEYVEGRLLKDIIAQGPVEPAEAVRIVDGILTALEYSHRAGVVHRDIKPGNVMITSSGQVKVMDFGIARAISDSAATIAQTSAILGTATYFSPEQARGESVDARTDLYSTGVVLYELLTGRAPFEGGTPVAVAYQHVSEAAAAPNTINPRISPALNAVVMRALAKDRFERFQTAADFRRDLDIAMSGKVPDRVPSTDDFNATLFGVNPSSTAASEATLRRLAENEDDRVPRTQSRPPVAWIWAGIAIVVVIVAAAAFWVLTLAPQQLVGNGAAAAIPKVVGMTFEDGKKAITDLGLRVRRVDESSTDVPADQIISTSPEEGTRVSPNFEVVVTVSSGPPLVGLPSLVFATEEDAKAALTAAGLVYGSTSSTYSPNVAAGTVMGILPEGASNIITGATQLRAGSKVDLVTSNGLVNVPDVKDMAVQEAQTTLIGPALQLTVRLEPDASCAGGNVTNQSMIGEVPQKSTIVLRYCAG